MEEYLVKDFSGISVEKRQEPKISLVTKEELWEIIQKIKECPREIAVYELGNCVLDWS